MGRQSEATNYRPDADKRFMDAAPATLLRDDYHRVTLSELGIHDPSRDLIAL
jgi:hypothetical protein